MFEDRQNHKKFFRIKVNTGIVGLKENLFSF